MSPRWICFALCLLTLNGCAWSHRKIPKAVAIESAPRVVGTVALVNEALGFELVDVGTLYVPAPGAALRCFSKGEETAVLAVTPERKPPFITADIVKGTPHTGDVVFE